MDNPGLRLAQGGLIIFAVIVLFLLFFALRDILLRTRSFWYQFFCIVIVTLFPIVGFLIYLLIRPARTIKQRELESMILTLVATEAPNQVEVGQSDDDDMKDDEDEAEDEEKKEEKKKDDSKHHNHAHHTSSSQS